MSYVFDIEGETVWSPSLRTGAMYIALTEAAGRTLERPTGLIAVAEDMRDIDLSTFNDFAQALLEYYSTTKHMVAHEMLRGILLTSLVMLQRGGVELASKNAEEAKILSALPNFSLSMPT
ncbi:hypothetical protein GCM10022254_42810 [Actinomadura meridiana]|uniref:Uncharacterized protein n=1 Tax=Actinomadura meridiana TaxID=559626 RepID=A0ABP8C8D6_9ACTN